MQCRVIRPGSNGISANMVDLLRSVRERLDDFALQMSIRPKVEEQSRQTMKTVFARLDGFYRCL